MHEYILGKHYLTKPNVTDEVVRMSFLGTSLAQFYRYTANYDTLAMKLILNHRFYKIEPNNKRRR